MTHLRKAMLEELQRRNLSNNTARAYIRAVEEFSRYYNASPDRLGPKHIREYQAHLFTDRKLDAISVSQQLTGLRFFFIKTLKRRWTLEDTPFPKRPVRLPEVLSQEEVERLINHTENRLHRIWLLILYSTGLRREELVNLKISDIDSARMLIHIRQGKGKRDRDVELTAKLLEELRDYWRWVQPKPTHYLFPSKGPHPNADAPMETKSVWNAVHEAAERADLTKQVHPHTMRHCFATHLLESGADLLTIQLQLGHADLKTTSRYLHVSERHLKATTNPLDSLTLTPAGDVKKLPRRNE